MPRIRHLLANIYTYIYRYRYHPLDKRHGFSKSVQPEFTSLLRVIFFNVKKKYIFQKLAGLWLVGKVVNHVGLYGSKVAEGCSAFQRRSFLYCSRQVFPSSTYMYSKAFCLASITGITTGMSIKRFKLRLLTWRSSAGRFHFQMCFSIESKMKCHEILGIISLLQWLNPVHVPIQQIPHGSDRVNHSPIKVPTGRRPFGIF